MDGGRHEVPVPDQSTSDNAEQAAPGRDDAGGMRSLENQRSRLWKAGDIRRIWCDYGLLSTGQK
jgi:hypothetical protein